MPHARLAAESADDSPLDLEVVASLRRIGERSGRDVCAELMALFLATADAELISVRRLLDARDFAEVARAAHALKGSSSVIGGRRAAAAAAALERAAIEAAAPAVDLALGNFVAELQAVREAITALPA